MKKSSSLKHGTVTREEINKDLLKVAKKFSKDHPGISTMGRDYYRVHGKFTEAAVASIYGNFRSAVQHINKESGKFTRDDIDYQHSAATPSGTHFISAAIAGGLANVKCLQSLAHFEKDRNATITTLGMRGILKNDETYSSAITDTRKESLCTEYRFNSNLVAIDMKLHPQQFKPLTGMNRLSSKSTSLIVAHPKQQMVVVPSQENMHSHMMWATGSITRPHYAQTRSGQFSYREHVDGGLIVEVMDDNSFHVRQIQFDRDGVFQDGRSIYTPSGVERLSPTESAADSMTLGDGHAGWVDPDARKATFEQIAYYRPEEVFIGDMFDGASITHHNLNNMYAKYKLPPHMRTLERELHSYAQELELYAKTFPWIKLSLVFGNHEDHLLQYLRQGRYVADIPENHYLALELARYMLDDKNPIEEWCNIHYPHLRKNVRWLKISDYIRRHGIMMSVHGHKGHSGAKGTIDSLEMSYGKSNTGHTHSGAIKNEAYVAGCMCRKDMPYTEGSASKWSHSNIVNLKARKGFVQRQMLNSFSSEWGMLVKR